MQLLDSTFAPTPIGFQPCLCFLEGLVINNMRHITRDVKAVLDSFQHLNAQGKRAAIQRVKELTYVPQYQNETTP